MKIICTRQVLAEAVSGVSKAVSQKNTLPSVEGILFSTEGNVVTMTGYNFELVITTSIEADVKEQGSCVLPARLLADFIKMADGDEVVIAVSDSLSTIVSSGKSEIKLVAIPAEEFPELPKPSTESSLCVNGGVLKEMIESTLYAVSANEQTPIYTGTKFVFEDNSLSLVSVDGFRLAIHTKPVLNSEQKTFVVPGRSLSEISKLISDDEKDIYINTARRYSVFCLSRYTIMTRLLEGEFLDYKRSIPEGYKTRVKIPVKEMCAAVERASLIVTERLKNPIKLEFSPVITKISCTTSLGSVNSEHEFSVEGEDVTISFNNRYLLDALRNCGCDEVYFEMNDSNRPLKVVPLAGDEFLHLVLPVRRTNE